MFYLEIVLRFLHLFGAIIMVGGSIFMRFGYGPAAAQLSDENRQAMQEAVIGQWRKWVMMSSGFLLLSGLVNTALTSIRYDLPSSYNAMLGIKLLLAFAVLFITSRLVGRSESAASMRTRMEHWLNVNLILALAVVALAGVMKLTDHVPKKKDEAAKVWRIIESNDAWTRKPRRS